MQRKDMPLPGKTSTESLCGDVLKYRWLVWALLVATYTIAFFHRMSVSVVKDSITMQFGLSATEFGVMASMYFYAYSIAQIPAGILVDSIGVRLTAFSSLLIAAAASVGFGYAASEPVLYASRFAVGIGVAASFICVMKIQSQWFREREFSTLSGICLFFGNMGSLSAQAPLALLVAALSFQGAFLTIGLMTFALSILCLAFVRNKPQDMGFEPVNLPPPTQIIEKISLGRSLKLVLTNRKLIPLYLFYFLSVPQFLAFAGTWSTTYIRDVYSLPLTVASNIASLQIIGFMLGSLTLGILSDRLEIRKPLFVLPSLIFTGLWLFLAFAGGSELPLTATAVCLFCIGFFTGTFSVMMAICKEHSPQEYTGSAIATLNTFGFLGIALATPIYGYIVDVFSHMGSAGQHKYAIAFIALITALGVLMTLSVKETFGKNVHAGKCI